MAISYTGKENKQKSVQGGKGAIAEARKAFTKLPGGGGVSFSAKGDKALEKDAKKSLNSKINAFSEKAARATKAPSQRRSTSDGSM